MISAIYGTMLRAIMARGGRVVNFFCILIVSSTVFAGCFGDSEIVKNEIMDWDVGLSYIENPGTFEDSREFVVGNPYDNQTWGNASWAVFDYHMDFQLQIL